MKFNQTKSAIRNKKLEVLKYWSERNEIPIGTVYPFEDYGDYIPREDVVTIPFDSVDTPLTSRSALNILLLAGTGDGKSLMMKTIWSVLHDAGFFCGYVDPKSGDSGRAIQEWKSNRLAPMMKPKGIKLKHFVPNWATENMEEYVHNFNLYSSRLDRINRISMWQGLGMTNVVATKVVDIIKRMGSDVTLQKIEDYMFNLDQSMLPTGSFKNFIRVFTDIKNIGLINENYDYVNLDREWRSGNSVCLSYYNADVHFISFDVGHKIRESAMLNTSKLPEERNPVFWFLDDASFYARNLPFLDINKNLAVREILNIGNNYRSLGLNNALAVQSLGLLNEDVAETYKIKLISPMFKRVDSLSKIGVPQKAIDLLKGNSYTQLIKDVNNYTIQWVMVDENDKCIPFFPFTPPCNHFRDILTPDYSVIEKKRRDVDWSIGQEGNEV